jgi:acetyl-CoA decarbonylase/synthase complex subunit gamma
MALTGLQIFKLLPGTNCRDCGYPTCLAFAMKLAAGRESLEKCPDASEEAKAALGAASAPPIRAVTIGIGERSIIIGEETVFFRHEKTFVHQPGMFRILDTAQLSEDEIERQINEWVAIRIERAGEFFQVDGIAVKQGTATPDRFVFAADTASKQGFPVAILSATRDGARAASERLKNARPLLVPPADSDQEPYQSIAAEFHLPLVVRGDDIESVVQRAGEATRRGVEDILLAPEAKSLSVLHQQLSQIRRGALDRVHPGLGYPVFLQISSGDIQRGILGITKFASILAVEDHGGETWLPLWTLRQNIYTDPQKPLQMDPKVYPIGEPSADSPLLVTTNFSLTYFIVSTELDGTGVPCHLAVVDAEGMSVLTAWSAGKFGGEQVAKALKKMGALELVNHKTIVIPGYVAVIAGELEDAVGDGWRVVTGPQEASDIGAFFKDFLPTS